MRLGSANTYDNTLANLTTRQADLASLQEKLSAGKRVVRASDDPTGAAQAERAMTRIARIETEQRALNIQRNSMTMAESTLGNAVETLQSIRDLVISAGNAGYSNINRTSIAQQISSLRDQLFTFANRQDSNGVPLFGGLGSATAPFTDQIVAGVQFQGTSGQHASTAVSIPSAMDGQAIWMSTPTGNGVYKVSLGTNTITGLANSGTAWSDVGQIINPSALTGDNYSISFSVVGGVTTYDVTDTTTATTVLSGQTYTSGKNIQFDGMSIRVEGVPSDGDTLAVASSTTTNIFKVVDDAIAAIKDKPYDNKLMQAYTRALAEIDAGMDRIQSARGLAGDLLNRADIIDSNQETKAVQIKSDQSRAEDIDMIKGISDFQNQQTGYDAALKTYAQVQRLSLFNYLG